MHWTRLGKNSAGEICAATALSDFAGGGVISMPRRNSTHAAQSSQGFGLRLAPPPEAQSPSGSSTPAHPAVALWRDPESVGTAAVLNKRKELAARRAELKAVFAMVESTREGLESALARAEATLADTATKCTSINADQVEAEANLNKARARCRQVRAALVHLELSELRALTAGPIDLLIEELREVSTHVSGINMTLTAPNRHGAHACNYVTQDDIGQRQSAQHPDVAALTRAAGRGGSPQLPPILRQSIGLFSLIMAYLLYFHIGVQLQILSLPSIFPQLIR